MWEGQFNPCIGQIGVALSRGRTCGLVRVTRVIFNALIFDLKKSWGSGWGLFSCTAIIIDCVKLEGSN